MDSQTLVTIMWTVLGAVATAFLGLLFWGVKKLIMTTFENTVQIKILNKHIEELIKLPLKIEKMERDLNIAHDRIRTVIKNGGPND